MILLLLACLDNDPLPADTSSFVAMQSDFAGFLEWESLEVSSNDTGHVSGERRVYLNQRPEAGSSVFPTGTIIVKSIESDQGMDLHAMVRRGGDFNEAGAVGWEWFELDLVEVPIILWRGTGPPMGEGYGVLPGQSQDSAGTTGDCNSCHGLVADNNYVHSIPLGE